MMAVALVSCVALAALSPDEKLEPGLRVEIHKHRGGNNLDEVGRNRGDCVRSDVDRVVDMNLGNGPLPGTDVRDNFLVRWSGVLRTPRDGEYTFTLESDDGSRLSINGKRVVDNDGLHAPAPKEGKIRLKKGDHPVLVEYFEASEGASCRLFWQGDKIKKQIVPASALFHPAKPAALAAEPDVHGLLGRYYHLGRSIGSFKDLGKLPKPKVERVDPQVNFPDVGGSDFAKTGLHDQIYASWTGFVRIPRKGRYTFFITSDDGSRLSINGKRIVDNDGTHGMVEKSGSLDLDIGDHELEVEFFQGGGGVGCILAWEGPSIKKQVIPASALHQDPVAAELSRALAGEARKKAKQLNEARKVLQERYRKETQAIKDRAQDRLKKLEEVFKKRREEERKRLSKPQENDFFPADKEHPHLIGKVELAFQDGPSTMMNLRKMGGNRDVDAVYLMPGAKTRYFELKRKDRKPKAGHVVYLWFQDNSRDQVAWATFCNEQDRSKLEKMRSDRRGLIEAKLREVDQERHKEEQKVREEQSRDLKVLRDRLNKEIRDLVKK